ncbi:non-hydrolyzing UDP-N-acetylglucosamine 2-epimerase, partial [Chloroflexota bacterium]
MIRAIEKHNASPRGNAIAPILVYTGQHYDYEMSQVFFQDMEIPQPDFHLDIGSGTHAEQTGKVMIEFEKVLFQEKPDIVVVVGDVNSTLAAALATVKMNISLAHVEAGLRSNDKSMPEEINRIVTDAVSDYLFTHSPDANENLRREGILQENIFFVGNIMVDSLLYNKTKAEHSQILSRLNLTEKGYAILTLHRPSNVDEKESLFMIVKALSEISKRIPVVFPSHPRTQKSLKDFNLLDHLPITDQQFLLTKPLGYIDFLKLEMS